MLGTSDGIASACSVIVPGGVGVGDGVGALDALPAGEPEGDGDGLAGTLKLNPHAYVCPCTTICGHFNPLGPLATGYCA